MPREQKEFLTAPSDRRLVVRGTIENADDGRISVIYKNWTKPSEDGTLVKEVPRLDHTLLLDELGFHDLVVAGIRASVQEGAVMRIGVTVEGAGDVIMSEKSVPFEGPAAVIRLNILTYKPH